MCICLVLAGLFAFVTTSILKEKELQRKGILTESTYKKLYFQE